MREHLRRMLNHLAWANDRVVQTLSQASTENPRPLELFSHVVGAEHVWISRIRGSAARHTPFPVLTLDECKSLGRENLLAFGAILSDATEQSLERNVHYTNLEGTAFDNPVGEILTHVCLHGSYHRGQIAALVRAGGTAPVPTDYIVFVRAGSPDALGLD